MVIHDRAAEQPSWADHGTQGFYIGPAKHHYRNYQCYIPGTKSIHVSNTVILFPRHTLITATSLSDKLLLVLQNPIDLLQHPSPPIPFPNYGTELHQCIRRLGKHMLPMTPKSKTTNNKTFLLPIATSRVLRSNTQRR